MQGKKKVLAISGSTRKGSVNHRYINSIQQLAEASIDILLYNGISELPHFNPDLDNEHPPLSVSELRNRIAEADGVLICTPEYAMGVPGSLKNAIDWTVSSCDFSKKPVALVTAGTSGLKAHASLLATLQVIEANVATDAQIVIPFAKAKLNELNEVKDSDTAAKLNRLIAAFIQTMEDGEIEKL